MNNASKEYEEKNTLLDYPNIVPLIPWKPIHILTKLT